MEQNDAAGIFAGLLVGAFVVLLFLSPFLVLVVGGLIGSAQQRKHFDELERRENALGDFLLTDLKTPPPGLNAAGAALVSGSVVIAADHFKTLRTKWRKLFGGEIRSLAKMQERARREAILRMVEEAKRLGATSVCNLRIETCAIGSRQEGKVTGCEIIAYGTASIPALPDANSRDAPAPLPGFPR